MIDSTEHLSIALFSGTDDRLQAAATLAVGAISMEHKVDVFLQFWALDAFRADRITADHGVSPEAGEDGAKLVRDSLATGTHWSDIFRQLKEIGELRIAACSASMDILGITKEDLDPMVDAVEGIASFTASCGERLVFI